MAVGEGSEIVETQADRKQKEIEVGAEFCYTAYSMDRTVQQQKLSVVRSKRLPRMKRVTVGLTQKKFIWVELAAKTLQIESTIEDRSIALKKLEEALKVTRHSSSEAF